MAYIIYLVINHTLPFDISSISNNYLNVSSFNFSHLDSSISVAWEAVIHRGYEQGFWSQTARFNTRPVQDTLAV